MEISPFQLISVLALAVAALASFSSAIGCWRWNKDFFQKGVGSHGMAYQLARLHHVARYALAAFCAVYVIAAAPVVGTLAVLMVVVLSRTTHRWGPLVPRLVHKVTDRNNITFVLVGLTAVLAGLELLESFDTSWMLAMGFSLVAGLSLAAVSAAHDDYTLELIRLG